MRKIIRKLVEIKITWEIINFFYKIFYRFKFEKNLIEIEKKKFLLSQKEQKMQTIFKDLKVLNGPFKGMIYPDFIAHGSSLYPKLLGSYESELYDDIEKLLKNNYDTILDIGCAEGYYAVGFAMRKPEATVFAYDLNKTALLACKQMAILNHVEKNMKFGEFCSAETLRDFPFKGKGLVLSDCEGFEIDLFTKEAVANLTNCDILIELHDLYNEKISVEIENAFKDTHTIKKVYSKSTFKKMREFELASKFTDDDINCFMLERNGIMEWAIITPKNN